MKFELTYEIAKQIFHVDFESGKLYWKDRTEEWFAESKHPKRSLAIWRANFLNKEALMTPNNEGYLQGEIKGVCFKAHRVIWLLAHGEWPDVIDHKNGNRRDNRLSNLRNVNKAQNSRNCKLRKDNTSGYNGVYWRKDKGLWQASIRYNTISCHLGYFENIEDAHQAVEKKKIELGFDKLHGKR